MIRANLIVHTFFHQLQENKQTNKLHNSHIVINNAGDLVAVYRKLHLFDVETPEFRFQESRVINSGDYIVSPLTNTPLQGGLGLLIVSSINHMENANVSSNPDIYFDNSVMIYDFLKLVLFCVNRVQPF